MFKHHEFAGLRFIICTMFNTHWSFCIRGCHGRKTGLQYRGQPTRNNALIPVTQALWHILACRVNSPIIGTYPYISMFIDYQIYLVFVTWIWYQEKYNVIVNLWRQYCGKQIAIFKIWCEIKWYLINLRFVATRSRSGHFYSSGLIMFWSMLWLWHVQKQMNAEWQINQRFPLCY